MREHHKNTQPVVEQLQASKTLITAIVKHAPNGIITVNAQGIIQSCNPKAVSLFGYTVDAMKGKHIGMLISQSHTVYQQGRSVSQPQYNVFSAVAGLPECECVGFKQGGTPFPIELVVANMDVSDNVYFLGFVHDISQRKEKEAQFEQMLTHDQTTGLINYKAFVERIHAVIDTAQAFMIFYVGLDRFQSVNEVLGHSTGDQVLDQVAKRLMAGIEAGVVLAHIGGSSFALLWPDSVGRNGSAVAFRT